MEIPLITKKIKKLNYLLLSIMGLMFYGIYSLEVLQQINQDDLNYRELIILFAVITIFMLFFFFVGNREYGKRNSRVIIDAKGIDFASGKLHHFVYWDDVEYVIIRRNIPQTYIAIYAGSQKHDFLSGYTHMPYPTPLRLLPNSTTDNFVYIPYSQQALDEVKKHFNKEIIDEYILHYRGKL